jgi:PIN domain nuclease of toxin-antitoxin system
LKLLLDTHVLLWSLHRPERLGSRARDWISDPDNIVLASIVSLWEIALKKRAGKMEAELGLVIDGIAEQGFTRLGVEDSHLMALLGLPSHHRDPFDHLLMAQAIAEQAAFVSQDEMANRYPVESVAAEK